MYNSDIRKGQALAILLLGGLLVLLLGFVPLAVNEGVIGVPGGGVEVLETQEGKGTTKFSLSDQK